jgi:predicted Zn-dependent peptidase
MFKRLVRKDGSVVLLVPKKDTQATTFEVLYKVGSRQEPAHLSGVSHFIEHLMFKGTPSRPHTADIARELDSVGAEYNAFTGKEHTGYYVMADHGHLPMAMDTLSDMLHNSKLDPEEIEREKGVIIEEINMYEDNPLMYIDDVFENLLYQGSVLGRSIAGTREIIRGVKRQSLWNYYQKYYYHGNAVFGVAGNFDQVKFLRLLDKLFPISKKQARVTIKPVRIPKQIKPALALVNREVEQVQLMLGFRTMPGTDKRFLALQLLAIKLIS